MPHDLKTYAIAGLFVLGVVLGYGIIGSTIGQVLGGTVNSIAGGAGGLVLGAITVLIAGGAYLWVRGKIRV